ncbi:hypothetical protein [Curtobacterium pusillum]|uniref:hypothetical protein n=1 Tax=Curtobacterium pusillum TaxID=69373 RepID=UPI00119CC05D|nr:hypothetical protein [Curtobacterium pusillum]
MRPNRETDPADLAVLDPAGLDPADVDPSDVDPSDVDPSDLDPEDAFGHTVIADPARDDAVWPDGDDDDIDV